MPIRYMTAAEVAALGREVEVAAPAVASPPIVVHGSRRPVRGTAGAVSRPGRRSHAHEPHTPAPESVRRVRASNYRNVPWTDLIDAEPPEHAAELANFVHWALHRVLPDGDVYRVIREKIANASAVVMHHAVQIAETKHQSARFASSRARWELTAATLSDEYAERFPNGPEV